MMSIAIRCDADARIGTGHFMRCLALADALSRDGASSHIISTTLPAPLHDHAEASGHSVTIVSDDDHALSELSVRNPDWLVVDHYELGIQFESRAREVCGALLVIEDLRDRPHACDILVNHTPLQPASDFADRVEPHCALLLGPQYAILRSEFGQHRKQTSNRWRRGLICFGGSDPENLVLRVLVTIEKVAELSDLEWTVVAGPANPHVRELQQFAATTSLRVDVLPSSNAVARLMQAHDFAVGAGGGMTWERACIGIPTLAMRIAENQQPGIEALERLGLAETLAPRQLNPTTLSAKLRAVRKNADTYRQRNQQLVDGNGAATIARTMVDRRAQLGSLREERL